MTYLEPLWVKTTKISLQHQSNGAATKIFEERGKRYVGAGEKIKGLGMNNLIILRSNPKPLSPSLQLSDLLSTFSLFLWPATGSLAHVFRLLLQETAFPWQSVLVFMSNPFLKSPWGSI